MEDYIVRGTAADNQIRVFAATTRALVEEARKAHNTSPGTIADWWCDDGKYDEGR